MSTKQTHAHGAPTSMTQNLGLLLARVPLGAYLLFAGYAGFSGGLAHFASGHHGMLGHLLPANVADGLLRCVPVAELAAGAFLVLGIFSRTGGLLAAVALATLLVATWDLRDRTGAMPFNPLVILAGFAIYLCVSGAGGLSLDRVVWGRGKHA